VFLGTEAVDQGYVDYLGNKDDALAHLARELNITAEPVDYKRTPTFMEALSGVSSGNFYSIGKGIGDSLTSVESSTTPQLVY